MKQALLARHELNKCTVRHHRFYYRIVSLADLRNGNDTLDPAHSFRKIIAIVGEYFHHPCFAYFFDRDLRIGFALYLLYDLTAGPDNRADKFTVDDQLLDTWRLRFQLRAWRIDTLVHSIEDM